MTIFLISFDFCRQLLKDYDEYCYVGFCMGMWVLPLMLAKKDDAIGAEELFADMDDEKAVEAAVARNNELQKKAFKNNLHIKMVMSGNYHEMLSRGFFKKYA